MVSTPKLMVLLAVAVVFSLFEVTDGADAPIECYSCTNAGTKKHTDCGGSTWIKIKTKPKVTCEGTKCVSVFNAKGGAVLRGCLDPKNHELEIIFKEHICVEKRPEIPKAYSNGVTACACKETLCNAGMDSASGIEVKIVMILGSPLLLLMINHFF